MRAPCVRRDARKIKTVGLYTHYTYMARKKIGYLPILHLLKGIKYTTNLRQSGV